MDNSNAKERQELLKQALTELRQHQSLFSKEAFEALVLVALEKLRNWQAIRTNDETVVFSSPLPPTPTPANSSDEIRLVTVMFIDIKDSTELSQMMEGSDWKRLLAEAHRRMKAIVEQWGGEVGQYLGDGLLCFFGAQRSSGDEAVRAVSAALSISAALESYANEVFLETGLEFAIRTGLSTGRVVVGLVGDHAKQDMLALGPSTNLAARLQSSAPAGGVLIDQATYARVRQQFITQTRPPQRVKGFDEPVASYLVTGRRSKDPAQLTQTDLVGLPLPLVGRDSILQNIIYSCENSIVNRQAQAVLVSGELGTGKSRLLLELLRSPVGISFNPVIMVAHYETRTTSYNLLRDWLATQCNLSEDAHQEAAEARILAFVNDNWHDPLAETVAAVLGYLAGFGFQEHPSIQQWRRRGAQSQDYAYALILRYLQGAAEGQGILIVVDNLQWADSESLALIEYLLRERRNQATVLVAAAHPTYRSQHPYFLRQFAPIAHLQLDPLNGESTRALISSVLQQVERVPEYLIETIQDRAEGNPLFIIEFLGMLFDNAVFQRTREGGWRFNLLRYDEALRNLPNGLVEVLQARLDDLPAEARALVQAAAVAGQSFWQTEVAQLLPDVPIDDLLGLLIQRGIIALQSESKFEGETQYTFRHSLYRDVAYEMLPRAKRQAYHREVAQWLAPRIADKPEYYGQLAEQYHAGGQALEAMYITIEAVQNRLLRGFFREALKLIDRGLSTANQVPRNQGQPLAARLWTNRAQALIGMRKFDEAVTSAQSALLLLNEATQEDLRPLRANAARLMGIACRSLGRYDDALEALSQSYEMVDESDPMQMSAVLRSFGSLMLYRGRTLESFTYQKRALEYAETAGNDEARAGSMAQLGIIAIERGQFATAIEYFEAALALNERQENLLFIAQGWRNIGTVHRLLLNSRLALECYERASTLLASINEDDSIMQAGLALTWLDLDRIDDAIALLHDLERRPHTDVYHSELVTIALMDCLMQTGDMLGCQQTALRFLDQTRRSNPLLSGRAMLRLGRANHFLGIPNSADLIRESIAREAEFGGCELWLARLYLAEILPTAEADVVLHEAAHNVRQVLAGLRTHPDLAVPFMHHPNIEALLQSYPEAG